MSKDELKPISCQCVCGLLVRFWSALDERGYCSDACYEKAHPVEVVKTKYVAHGVFEVVSEPEDEQEFLNELPGE